MPDAGASCFWYDYLGRLILSQNAKQLDNSQMSYTLFDKLGRTVEVGESYWAWDGISPVPFTAFTTYSNIEQYYNAVDNHAKTLKKPQDFIYQYNNFGLEKRWDVTRTFYDKTPNNAPVIPNFTPENLRNRVATTVAYDHSYHDYADPDNDGYDNGGIRIATSYNYDVAGNVKTMVHDIPELAGFQYQNNGESRNHQFKRLDYDYDLVSGKVNQLFYQRDEADQFIYRYVYDKDNRLTEALTSTNGITWDREATYQYYKHGPLSRIVLGRANNRVQGMDYAYTLQGWIKGVNASFLDPNREMGKDGIAGANATVRKDAFGYTISYFDGDYKPIGGANSQFAVQGTGTASTASAYASKGLFNGNIRSIASQTEKLGNPILMTYDYDQLNRLNKMESWGGLTATSKTWNRTTDPLSNWRENVVYDPNGNILTYKRADETGALIDDLTYNYNRDINQRLTNNRLASVGDAVTSSPNYGDDLEGTAAENAFQYDQIGNLTYSAKDTTSYYWNVYGKLGGAYSNNYVSTSTGYLQKYRGSYFNYDVQQNRYRKTSYNGTSNSVNQTNLYKYSNKYNYDTDFYIRDAQGNVLAIYNQKYGGDYTYTQTYDPITKRWSYNSVNNSPPYNTFALKEQHLYGSSRLGTLSLDRPMFNNINIDPSDTTTQTTGAKQYELTNHLGNVLATITDKGIITSAQAYFPFFPR